MKFAPMLLTLVYFLTLTYTALSSNDGRSLSDFNCCEVVSDAALCCPYTNGICCHDNYHCCPESSSCHPGTNQTICVPRSKLGLPLIRNLHSAAPLHLRDLKNEPKNKICPSKLLECPKKSTCCPVPYLGYDCCPLSRGVCCEDFQHCCPHNSSCEAKTKQCISHTGEKFPWVKKLTAKRLTKYTKSKAVTKNVASLDPICSHNDCLGNQTCCSNSFGKSSCCSLPDAVCCSNGIYCCPKGSSCSNNFTCVGKTKNKFYGTIIPGEYLPKFKQESSSMWQKKMTSNATVTLICPGGQYSCPSGMSCCPSPKGAYGCCPFPRSVCCADKWHCCPAGSVCDLERNICTRGGLFIPLFSTSKKYEVNKIPVAAVIICPDYSECPDKTTCCELPDGKYGCCPLDKAVCCSDKIHCCPYRTVCDLEAKGCRPGKGMKLLTFYDIVNSTNTTTSP